VSVARHAEHIREEIGNIAAMGEEQVGTLQEVAATSDLLMDRIRKMDKAVSSFRI